MKPAQFRFGQQSSERGLYRPGEHKCRHGGIDPVRFESLKKDIAATDINVAVNWKSRGEGSSLSVSAGSFAAAHCACPQPNPRLLQFRLRRPPHSRPAKLPPLLLPSLLQHPARVRRLRPPRHRQQLHRPPRLQNSFLKKEGIYKERFFVAFARAQNDNFYVILSASEGSIFFSTRP